MVNTALAPEQFKRIAQRNTILPMLICIVLIMIFSFLINQLTSALRTVQDSNKILAKAHYATQLAIEAQNGLRGFIITQNREFLQPYTDSKDLVLKEWDDLEKMVIDNPIQVLRVQKIKQVQDNWLQYAEDTLRARSHTEMINKTEIINGRMFMQEIRNTVGEFTREEENLLTARSKSAQETVTQTFTIVVIFGLITGVFLAFFARKQLNEVSNSYGVALNKAAQHNSLLERQDWLKSLQVTLTNQTKGIVNLDEISKNILDLICETLDAKVGVLYLADKQNNFNLSASHALAPDEIGSKKLVKLNEGLVGKVAQSMKPIILEMPENYLKISSSLIDANPKSVVIFPILSNEETIAVIEIASTSAFTTNDHEVIESVSTTAANIISGAKYTHHIQMLLEESRRFSEELQSQQEELKTSNEELEQQTQALKETHVRLQNQQAELEQTNQLLEEQTKMLENQHTILDERNKNLNESQKLLEEKSQEIVRASQYKSEFLANMSHELRTPLNSTLILAKLLSENKSGNMTQDQIKYADIIYTSGNDLLNLINDILDLSKVEAGKMSIHPEVVHVESLVENLKVMFTPMTKDKNLDFVIESNKNVPLNFITDRMRIEQILRNLLSNAVKFTNQGKITLDVSSSQDGIKFAVKDSGIGISQEQQDVIFEAFRQADGTTNRKYGGTGLGLSISKELSNLLGGKLEVESTPGQGSIFTLTLPLQYTEKVKEEEKPRMVISAPDIKPPEPEKVIVPEVKFSFEDDRNKLKPGSRKILIVEDDENFAKILFDLSHEKQFDAILTSTAEEAVRLANLYVPQAIILDIRLPDDSGLLVLDQLKSNGKTRHIPVHVISAEDFSRSALEMGAIGHMLKPLKREQLLKAFSSLSSVMGKKEKAVLIVEDDQIQGQHIKELISDTNIHIDLVETATEALEYLSKKTYDCMIMDLSLPDFSGHELLSKLSNDTDKYSYPPVIIYTARDLTIEEEEKLRLYSGSIIIKGARSPERLLNEVTLFLHRVETDLPPERQKMLTDLRQRDKSLEGKNILVVDDDIRNIFALSAALENFGAKIHVARNGREAVERVRAGSLDIVLMDIMMPEMDGYEAMKIIRADDKYKKLPIIALTAKAMRDDQERCIEAGANDYLSKPINVEKLISLIRVWMSNQRNFVS